MPDAVIFATASRHGARRHAGDGDQVRPVPAAEPGPTKFKAPPSAWKAAVQLSLGRQRFRARPAQYRRQARDHGAEMSRAASSPARPPRRSRRRVQRSLSPAQSGRRRAHIAMITRAAAEDGPAPIYFQHPDGKPEYSLDSEENAGRPRRIVRCPPAPMPASTRQLPLRRRRAAGTPRSEYYRNPMGLPDTSARAEEGLHGDGLHRALRGRRYATMAQ
mgnify:CR=1 FL=1